MKSEFSKFLCDYRKRNNKTMKEMADAVGVSYAAWQMWETGTRRPAGRLRGQLEEFFGMEPGTIQRMFDTEDGTETKADYMVDIENAMLNVLIEYDNREKRLSDTQKRCIAYIEKMSEAELTGIQSILETMNRKK